MKEYVSAPIAYTQSWWPGWMCTVTGTPSLRSRPPIQAAWPRISGSGSEASSSSRTCMPRACQGWADGVFWAITDGLPPNMPDRSFTTKYPASETT